MRDAVKTPETDAEIRMTLNRENPADLSTGGRDMIPREVMANPSQAPAPAGEALRALFALYPDVLYGFADIGYSPYADRYASALVFAVPYGEQLTLETYVEARFDRGIQTARARLEEIVGRVEALLRERDVPFWTPPVAQENEQDLLAPFSFKYAAARAGLGWIGRNDVVVTRRYGPRVRLSAVLIDAPFAYGPPTLASACPEDCRACVQACPCKALSGRLWDPDALRRELIDYHRCNRMRSAFIGKLGRKNACGLCLAACPIGREPTLRPAATRQ